MEKMEKAIAESFKNCARKEMLEWVKEHISDCDKCLIVCGYHNPETKALDLEATQMGFDYIYELNGFLNLVGEFFETENEE